MWKDIPNYEGHYQVNDIGEVRSLKTNKILKQSIDSSGYYMVGLRKNVNKNFRVHQLVAMAFLNHKPIGHKLVIDHINDNKLDNRLCNLQIVTNRFNSFKTQGSYSSQYKGVYKNNNAKKWLAQIRIDGVKKHIGYFDNEYEAHLAYQDKLREYDQM